MDETTPSVGEEVNDQVAGDSQDTSTDQDSVESESIDISSIDPSTLAPELQAIHKSLLGDYTAKTQEIADIKNRAAAFDELMGNPQFSKLVENLDKYGNVQPQPEPTVQEMSGEEILTKIIEDPKWLQNEIERVAREQTKPLFDSEAQRTADSTIKELSAKYPDFMDYQDKIAARIEKSCSNMDPEDAYRLETYDKSVQKGANMGAQVTQQRINAAGAKGSPATVVSDKTAKTIQEAYAAARKQHGL
jgi:hypothetical protein